MQDLLELMVSKRTPGQTVEGVRGVVYGKEQPSVSIATDQLKLERLYNTAGHNRVFDLKIEGEQPIKVLFQDIQRDPVTNHIIHFDLHAMSLKEKITAAVPVHVIGESQAIILHEATLSTVTDTIEVEAEPLSLPERFEVDISGLKEANDHITVASLSVPPGVEILSDPDLVIVKLDAVVEEVDEEPEPIILEEDQEGEAGEEDGETAEGDEGGETPSPDKADTDNKDET